MVAKTTDERVWRWFLALLILAPLPSGSIAPSAQALLTLLIFILLATWATRPILHTFSRLQQNEGHFHALLITLVLAVAVAVFQVIPLPPEMVAFLSPSLHDLYGWTLPDENVRRSWRSLSTTPGTTIQSALLISACGATFFLVTQLCSTRKRLLIVGLTVVLVGLGEALYGLAQTSGSLARPASGTYVNRNHFSALLAMTLCVAVGLLFARWQEGYLFQQGKTTMPELGKRFDRWTQGSPLVVASLSVLAGIVFSLSRMGLTTPLIMLLVFGTIWMFGPISGRMRLVGATIGAVTLLLFAGAWPALEAATERFQHLEDIYRVAAWEGTYNVFRSSPIVGVGLGGLVDNLPRVLATPVEGIFDHAHNDLLEVFAEGGVVYGGLVVLGLTLYFWTLVPAWFSRHDPLARGLGLGCLAGTGSILLHSLIDFPLRMPANALFLSVVMAMGWVVILQREETRQPDAGELSARIPSHTSIARTIIRVVALVGIGFSALALCADFLDRAGDGMVAQASEMSGAARRDKLEKAAAFYQRAHRFEPWQPAHPFKLGRAHEINATTLPSLSHEGQAEWAASALSYERAVRLHPANARLQTAFAWAAIQSGDPARGRRASQAAAKLAPDDPDVRFAVARSHLVQWDALAADERRLALSLIQRGARESPERYVEATWQLLPDPKTARQILPGDLPARRLLLGKLTENGFFSDRWEEQATYPNLRVQSPPNGLLIVSHGQLTGRQVPPPEAGSAVQWTGMVEGWLSAGQTARVTLELPPGEVVLYIPILGEAAGGIWPTLTMALGDHGLPLPAIIGPGWRTARILLSTPGGKLPLQATLTNGAVILERGEFVERRVSLGPVRMLSTHHTH